VVDNHRDEASLVELEIVLEEMLVDADLLGPRVQAFAALELELGGTTIAVSLSREPPARRAADRTAPFSSPLEITRPR